MLVHGFDKPEECARELHMTGSALASSGSRAEILGEDDAADGAFRVELQSAKALVRAALNECNKSTVDMIAGVIQHYLVVLRRYAGASTVTVPKHRVFVLAMLYVMRDGICSGGVVLVQKNRVIEALLPDYTHLPHGVLQDKPKALTTAITFVKRCLGDAVTRGGSALLVQKDIDL
jgi:hypothetical protein